MSRANKTERQEALEHLRSVLKPGDEIYTQCQHVSASGMTRWLDVSTCETTGRTGSPGQSAPLLISSFATVAVS